jgi:hypothetical protein
MGGEYSDLFLSRSPLNIARSQPTARYVYVQFHRVIGWTVVFALRPHLVAAPSFHRPVYELIPVCAADSLSMPFHSQALFAPLACVRMSKTFESGTHRVSGLVELGYSTRKACCGWRGGGGRLVSPRFETCQLTSLRRAAGGPSLWFFPFNPSLSPRLNCYDVTPYHPLLQRYDEEPRAGIRRSLRRFVL